MLRDPHTQISDSAGYQDVRRRTCVPLFQKDRGKYEKYKRYIL